MLSAPVDSATFARPAHASRHVAAVVGAHANAVPDARARRAVDRPERRVDQLGRILGRLHVLLEHVEVRQHAAGGRERRDALLAEIGERARD